MRLKYSLLVLVLLAFSAAGCSISEKSEAQKDRVDPESMKAASKVLENPPPGVPGAPPAAKKTAPPGMPAPNSSPTGMPADSSTLPGPPGMPPPPR